MNNDLKYKIISLLQQPTLTAHMIAEELDVSYSAVLRIDKEYQEAKLNNTLMDLVDGDSSVLMSAAEVLDMDQVSLTKGLKGLDKLSEDLQVTASQINNRVRSLLMGVEHLSDVETAAKIICQLNEAFVNTKQTQVNVQNNFGGEHHASSRYAGLLSDTPQS